MYLSPFLCPEMLGRAEGPILTESPDLHQGRDGKLSMFQYRCLYASSGITGHSHINSLWGCHSTWNRKAWTAECPDTVKAITKVSSAVEEETFADVIVEPRSLRSREHHRTWRIVFPLTMLILRRAIKHPLVSIEEFSESYRPAGGPWSDTRTPDPAAWEKAILICIHRHRLADGAQIGLTLNPLHLLLDSRQHWEEKCDENRDDGDDDKQL